MANLNAVFSNLLPCRLRVTFSGVFYAGVSTNTGFPPGNSAGDDYLVGGYINGSFIGAISRFTPSREIDISYPGLNAAWPVTTSTIASVSGGGGGLRSWGIQQLRITVQMLKR